MAYLGEAFWWFIVLSIGLMLVVLHSPCVVSTDEADGQVDDGCLRLVGGETSEEGRVELHINGTWGTICDDGWSIEEADVACLQLGFGPAAAAPPRAHFGEGTLPILMDDTRCSGNERTLLQCQFSRVHNCQHHEDASVVCTQVAEGDIRLVGGDNRNEGNVEVHLGGQWGSVCHDAWGLEDTEVACKQLGLGNALENVTTTRFGLGRAPALMNDVKCFGNERMLTECSYAANRSCDLNGGDAIGIGCKEPEPGSVRLLGGSNPSEGRIEIYVDGEWGSVCDSRWALPAARVVCRQLGFHEALAAVRDATYGRAQEPVQMASVVCLGEEATLLDCQHTPRDKVSCSHGRDAGVICTTEEGAIRLVNGDDVSGTVEVYLDGVWGTICDDDWGIDDANVVCNQLGFIGAIYSPVGANFGEGSGKVLMNEVGCSGSEVRLVDCPRPGSLANCTHGQDAGAVCTKIIDQSTPRFREDLGCAGSHHIAGKPSECDPDSDNPCCSAYTWCGNTPDHCDCLGCVDYRNDRFLIYFADGNHIAGRVVLYSYGDWRTVCDDGWGIEDAHVACRQNGFSGAVAALGGSYFGGGYGLTQMNGFGCSGQEERLVDCPHFISPSDDCGHDNDAGVVCFLGINETRGIRLADGNDTAGRVEVFIDNEWGTVCDDYWGRDDAHVACRQLGFSGAISSAHPIPSGEGLIQMDDINCSGSEERLVECPHIGSSSTNCGHHEDVGIACYSETEEISAVRLVGGDDASGTVEVYLDSTWSWGTICDRNWGIRAANVVCRQLGFLGAIFSSVGAHLGEGRRKAQMDNVQCSGSEQRIIDCSYSRTPFCGQSRGAGVVCSNDTAFGAIRLVNGDDASGTVEVNLNGTWGTICDTDWEMEDANVACIQLGFIGAISSPRGAYFGEGGGMVVLDDIACSGSEQRIVDCARYGSPANCSDGQDAGVVCTDVTDQSTPRFREDNRCGGSYHIGGKSAECDPDGHNSCCSYNNWCGNTSDHCDCIHSGCVDYREDRSLIRFADGNYTAGRVELYSYGEWRTVCGDGWGIEDAHVACRQQGFSEAAAALGGAYFGEGLGLTQMNDFGCSGQEEKLVDCPHFISPSDDCGHDNDAGVVCFLEINETRGIRLANGNDTAGRVEVFENGNGVWGTVCDDHWDMDDAHVACRQLGFSGASFAATQGLFGEGTGRIQMDDVKCSGSEERLVECPHIGSASENCGHHEDAGVVCYNATEDIGAIRLVSGNSTSGRVEIYLEGQWGTVCDDRWDIDDADVVCRQLGFDGAISAPTGAYFGEGTGRTQMDNVECHGDEERLMDCSHVDYREEDCGHYEDAGVVCEARGDL